jgi:hypothetical protein
MCTVSFIPRSGGFLLGMNRDEQLSRPMGLAPQRVSADGCQFLYPREPGGGTWAGVNDRGVALALINWYRQPQRGSKDSCSRGAVVRQLLPCLDVRHIGMELRRLPLDRMNPFRLVVIYEPLNLLNEWRWNGVKLRNLAFSWLRRHWFSSGYDEPGAVRVRRKICQEAVLEPRRHALAWLRKLHASHRPVGGPYSICMHRSDAATVSYTEISVQIKSARISYHPGSPCSSNQLKTQWLKLHK